jgi:hypothetical protein
VEVTQVALEVMELRTQVAVALAVLVQLVVPTMLQQTVVQVL